MGRACPFLGLLMSAACAAPPPLDNPHRVPAVSSLARQSPSQCRFPASPSQAGGCGGQLCAPHLIGLMREGPLSGL